MKGKPKALAIPIRYSCGITGAVWITGACTTGTVTVWGGVTSTTATVSSGSFAGVGVLVLDLDLFLKRMQVSDENFHLINRKYIYHDFFSVVKKNKLLFI